MGFLGTSKGEKQDVVDSLPEQPEDVNAEDKALIQEIENLEQDQNATEERLIKLRNALKRKRWDRTDEGRRWAEERRRKKEAEEKASKDIEFQYKLRELGAKRRVILDKILDEGERRFKVSPSEVIEKLNELSTQDPDFWRYDSAVIRRAKEVNE